VSCYSHRPDAAQQWAKDCLSEAWRSRKPVWGVERLHSCLRRGETVRLSEAWRHGVGLQRCPRTWPALSHGALQLRMDAWAHMHACIRTRPLASTPATLIRVGLSVTAFASAIALRMPEMLAWPSCMAGDATGHGSAKWPYSCRPQVNRYLTWERTQPRWWCGGAPSSSLSRLVFQQCARSWISYVILSMSAEALVLENVPARFQRLPGL